MTTNRIRRALVTTLAGLTLTAGLGLGGAGMADAAQPQKVTCVKNLTGSTKISNPWRTEAYPVSKPGFLACVPKGEKASIYVNGGAAGNQQGAAYLRVIGQENSVQADLQTMLATGKLSLGNAHIQNVTGPVHQVSTAKDGDFAQMTTDIQYEVVTIG